MHTARIVFIAFVWAGLAAGCTTTYQPPPNSEYWVQQGQVWKGVTSGNGEQVRTRDKICRNQDCLLVHWHWPVNSVMRKYDLLNLQYESLEGIALEKKPDGRIRLPEDLGAQIYWRLYREKIQEDRSDRFERLRRHH